jgi:hypothetical protein
MEKLMELVPQPESQPEVETFDVENQFSMGLLKHTKLFIARLLDTDLVSESDGLVIIIGPSLTIAGLALQYNLTEPSSENLSILLADLSTTPFTVIVGDMVKAQLELFENSARHGPSTVNPETVKYLEPMLALAQWYGLH